MRFCSSLVAALIVLAATSAARGQITVYDPVVTTFGSPDPVTVWRPVDPVDVPATTVTPAGTTTVTYSTPYTTSYSVPVVTRYAPSVSGSTTAYYYSEPTTTYYSPPVTTTYYSPPVTTTYYSSSAVSAPVVSAPVTTYYAPAPVISYSPGVVYSPAPSYVVGRGSLGQPVAYVPGQPVRNVLRFFSP